MGSRDKCSAHLVLRRLPRLPCLPRGRLELAVAVGGAHEVAQQGRHEGRRCRRQAAAVVAQGGQLAAQVRQLRLHRHEGRLIGCWGRLVSAAVDRAQS